MTNVGLVEKEEKPFWARYLKTDNGPTVLEEPGSILDKVLDVMDGRKAVDELIAEDNP
jgi:hypothetical protein